LVHCEVRETDCSKRNSAHARRQRPESGSWQVVPVGVEQEERYVELGVLMGDDPLHGDGGRHGLGSHRVHESDLIVGVISALERMSSAQG
jgi:hypothetical protein